MTRKLFQRRAAALAVRALAPGEAELLVYDEIGFWGITAKDFAAQLSGVEAATIHLRVNSPGGDVFDGVAIYNALRAHGAKIVTHVDGVAASIASVIALAGDEVRMAKNAMFMIHQPWGITIGNAADHRKTADTLDKVADAMIVQTYVDATGLGEDELRSMMDDETWLDATEAVDTGFADVVDDREAVENRFDLSLFNHVPPRLAATAAPSKRDAERSLRDAGLSRREAKQALAPRPRPAAADRRDAEPDRLLTPLRDFAELLRGA